MKAVKSMALPILGIARKATLKLGTWSSLVDFVIVKMDEFDVVLGMEFLLEHKLIPMSLAKCLVIIGSTHTVVQTSIKHSDEIKMISALQLKQGLAHNEPTFMAIPVVETKGTIKFVPIVIQRVLEEYHEVMSESLPKILPPRRDIAHETELMSRLKPPTKMKEKNNRRAEEVKTHKLIFFFCGVFRT